MALRADRIPRLSRALAAVVAVLLTAACGARDDVFETPPGLLTENGTLELPPAVPAAPAFVVSSESPPEDLVGSVQETPGVAVAAPVSLRRVRVEGPAGAARLTIGMVRPLQFRSVAPPATRDADFVWFALLSGRAVVTFEAADELGLDEAGEVRIAGVGDLAVGAFAENGTPENVADVLVSAESPTGEALSAEAGTVVVGAETGTVLERLGRDLKRSVPGARLRRLTPEANARPQPGGGRAPAPAGGSSNGAIGAMSFEILKDGFIRPDPVWVRSNIASAPVPVLGTITCHRLMFPQLRGALTEIQQRGLDRLIRPGDYGGCFVPRFIDRDPSKPLSMHAFGLAVDLNVSTNGLGTRGDIDPRIVEVFEKWGFEWGGRWSRPDPMHFELDRLLSN
ncbi:MAG TPA: M15 family metallopeptidase [Actinomycetota bacterium]|nr:M15 family metallopeptidase [Actinomycetota bacterium]